MSTHIRFSKFEILEHLPYDAFHAHHTLTRKYGPMHERFWYLSNQQAEKAQENLWVQDENFLNPELLKFKF